MRVSFVLMFVVACTSSSGSFPIEPDAVVDAAGFPYDGPEEGDACEPASPICADDHKPVPGVCIRGICRLQCYPQCPAGEVEMYAMRDTANVCYCAAPGDTR